MPVDVTELGRDFLAFSTQDDGPDRHRRALGQAELLEAMDPFLGGGG